jgi:cytochrome c oxidase subunit IV
MSIEQTSLEHAEPNYMKIFWWLLAFTIFEVGIIYAHLPHSLLIAALILTALIKALLVAINFMHLRFERWTLIAVTILPLLLVIDLLVALLPDIAHVPF